MFRPFLSLSRFLLSLPTFRLQHDHCSVYAAGNSAGTWKLVSYVREEIPSGVKSDVMGPHPQGYINYGRDGRMIIVIVGSNRRKPAEAVATPLEAAALLKSMLAYAGTFTVDSQAKTVTHHVEMSWDESRTGKDQVRRFKLEGNTLKLTTDPSIDPATGEKTIRELIWHRD